MYVRLLTDEEFHQAFTLQQEEITFLEDFEGEDDRLTEEQVAALNAAEI